MNRERAETIAGSVIRTALLYGYVQLAIAPDATPGVPLTRIAVSDRPELEDPPLPYIMIGTYDGAAEKEAIVQDLLASEVA